MTKTDRTVGSCGNLLRFYAYRSGANDVRWAKCVLCDKTSLLQASFRRTGLRSNVFHCTLISYYKCFGGDGIVGENNLWCVFNSQFRWGCRWFFIISIPAKLADELSKPPRYGLLFQLIGREHCYHMSNAYVSVERTIFQSFDRLHVILPTLKLMLISYQCELNSEDYRSPHWAANSLKMRQIISRAGLPGWADNSDASASALRFSINSCSQSTRLLRKTTRTSSKRKLNLLRINSKHIAERLAR